MKNKKKKEKDFKLWTKISNVDDDRKKNSSRMFTIGKNVAAAELTMDKAKAFLEQTKAKARLKWSKKKVDGKKMSIPQIDAKVVSDESVLTAENNYLESKYFFKVCLSASIAMKEKGQQLTNITNSRNAELKLKYVPNGKAREERIKKRLN